MDESFPPAAEVKQAEAGPSSPSSALCSAYPQLGSVNTWARPGVLYWNTQGQIVCHSSIQVTIATPYHPLPPYISPDSQLGKKPAPRPRQIVISDSTAAVPPETDQAFPMHINKFAIDRLDGEIEDKLEQVEFYDSDAGTFYRPRSYHIKGITSSPNHLSFGSPIIALLDSSLNVTLYNFAKGTVSGAEKRLVNITGEQMRLQGPLPPPGKYEDANDELKAEYRARTAELRTNCIAWSPAPCFGRPIGRVPSASLLALGNRKGELQFWSVGTDDDVKRVWTGQMGGEEWIVELCWSGWETVDAVTCQAKLVFVTSSQQVRIVRVMRRHLVADRFELEVGEAEQAIPADKRAIEGMKWVHGVLVIVKVGIVQICLPELGTVKTLLLSKVGDWTGCAGTSPCGGIGALNNDAALITLWSGEVHIIRNLTSDPSIDRNASIASSKAILDSIQELDKQIVESQREKQGGELRFTEQFSENMTLRIVGADTSGTLLGIIFEPVALNDLTLIRDGSIKHWVAVIDLVKTLGEGLADDNGSGEDFGEAQPASQMQTYLPRWYKSEASIEVDDATNEDMPMIKDPVEQTPNVDLRKALRYELLESPIARREQFRTVKQLWQSAFRRDVVQASNTIARRTISVKREMLDFFADSLDRSPDLVKTNATFLRNWLESVPVSRGLDDQIARLAAMIPPSGDQSSETIIEGLVDCPICLESLTEHRGDDASGSGGELRCDTWHIWQRCDLTRRVITDGAVRSCYTCRKQVLAPRSEAANEAANDLGQVTLTALTDCPWCGSDWT